MDLDLRPLAAYLREHDDVEESGWNTVLVVDTLDQLSRRGNEPATHILLDYLHWGCWWKNPFYDSSASRNEAFNAGAARALEERFPSDDELKEAIDWLWLDDPQWQAS